MVVKANINKIIKGNGGKIKNDKIIFAKKQVEVIVTSRDLLPLSTEVIIEKNNIFIETHTAHFSRVLKTVIKNIEKAKEELEKALTILDYESETLERFEF